MMIMPMVMAVVAMIGIVMIVVMVSVVAMVGMGHGLILHAPESCSKHKQVCMREKRGQLALAYGWL